MTYSIDRTLGISTRGSNIKSQKQPVLSILVAHPSLVKLGEWSVLYSFAPARRPTMPT
jgi:hypothetical protein